MREPSFIPTERVRACLRERYGLGGVTLEFLPRGHDYRAGVYRVVSTHGAAYLLKVTSRPLYEPSCLIPRFLHEQGITAVVAPIPTKDGALWICLAEWTLLVYLFLDGETSLVGMTNEHWREVGTIFQRIHQTQLPPTGLTALRKETFDPTEYVRWVRAFEAQHLHTRDDGNEAARALRAAWGTHRATIHTAVVTLERLAGVLQAQALPAVICHADLHAANLLRDPAGQVYVLDWDEVMLAPKERDFIFIRGPREDGVPRPQGR